MVEMLENLQIIQQALLRGRTWRYLRYLHFREYLSRVSNEVETVCVCGAGHGLAELACAIEFPHIEFTLTDIIAEGYPNYHRAMSHAWRWGINNMRFSVWNVLHVTDRRFDLVASTEMLEHVPDIPRAVRNMRKAATKYVYCLVPFADDRTNADTAKRQRVWADHKHFVFGFDRKSMESLFGQAEHIAGAYWSDAGLPFRQKLMTMADSDIDSAVEELVRQAVSDLRDDVPNTLKDAAGIKILARADTTVQATPLLPPSLEEVQLSAAAG
jgi:hypothetical protein